MNMELTDSNKAEIQVIAQEVVKGYSSNVKEMFEKLTSDVKEMVSLHNTVVDGKLDKITTHFDDKIELVITERKASISELKLDMKVLRLQLLSKKDVVYIVSKVFIILGAISTTIAGVFTMLTIYL